VQGTDKLLRCPVAVSCLGVLLVAGLVAAPALAADNELTAQEKAEGWKLLFNGKDLTGWGHRSKGPIKNWKVEDGAIVLRHTEDRPVWNDLIYLDEKFENFHLSLDWKAECNSGVFVRAGVPNTPWAYLEIAISGNYKNPKLVPPLHADGALYSLAAPPREVRSHEGWNNFYIICDGPIIACKMNSVETFRVDFREEKWRQPQGKFKLIFADLPRQGWIVLQDHGSKDKFLGFKNIKVKVLPDRK